MQKKMREKKKNRPEAWCRTHKTVCGEMAINEEKTTKKQKIHNKHNDKKSQLRNHAREKHEKCSQTLTQTPL